MRRPENITYWLNEKPPFHIGLVLGFQQVSFLAVYLAVSPLFARTLNLTHEQTVQLIAATLLSSGIGAMLQPLRLFGLGSGYFCPLQGTSSTLGALVLTKMTGGITAMFGAISILGLSQILFASLFVRLKSIFTIQIAGISIMLIGLGLGHTGLKLILEPHPGVLPTDEELIVCGLTLGSMIAFNVWSSGLLRLFSAFLGLSIGVLASLYFGAIPESSWAMIADAPLFFIPKPLHIGWDLETTTIVPCILTGLFLALHSFGAVTSAQRFNDANWKRPDMQSVRAGIMAEGLTNILSSFFNGLPITCSGGAVSLAAATGCTSRYLAYTLGLILIVLAFMPKAILFWEILPESVMGSAMIFLACFTSMAGLQIIASRLLDNRKIIIIGIGLLFGITYESLRVVLEHHAPDTFRNVIFSGVGFGVIAAVLLSIIFRIGDRTRQRRVFDALQGSMDELISFLERQGKSWGARADVVRRAEYATWQAFEILTENDVVIADASGNAPIELETAFNEFTFTVVLRYQGHAVKLAQRPPSHEDLLANEDAVTQMAGYLLRRLADKVSIDCDEKHCELKLTFDD